MSTPSRTDALNKENALADLERQTSCQLGGSIACRTVTSPGGSAASLRTDVSVRDWPEDFADDNGCYAHTCMTCGAGFTGHKHRPKVCKVCHEKGVAEVERRDELVRRAGLNPDEWIIQPRTEFGRTMSDAVRAVIERNLERRLRRELAAALDRLLDCISETRGKNAYYAVEDGRATLEKSVRMDAEIAAKEGLRIASTTDSTSTTTGSLIQQG